MLQALSASLGIVSTAAKSVGIDRSTHYKWLDSDPEYKAAYESINEDAIDYVESKLYEQVDNKDTTAIIFYLKTKGKKRGYVERQEVEHQGNGLNLSIIMPEGE